MSNNTGINKPYTLKKKKKKQKNRKDIVTPDFSNPRHVEELEWLYKKELKKRGLRGA